LIALVTANLSYRKKLDRFGFVILSAARVTAKPK